MGKGAANHTLIPPVAPPPPLKNCLSTPAADYFPYLKRILLIGVEPAAGGHQRLESGGQRGGGRHLMDIINKNHSPSPQGNHNHLETRGEHVVFFPNREFLARKNKLAVQYCGAGAARSRTFFRAIFEFRVLQFILVRVSLSLSQGEASHFTKCLVLKMRIMATILWEMKGFRRLGHGDSHNPPPT